MAKNPIYRTRAWQVARRAVFARDGRICQLRLPRCTGYANHVHHVGGVDVGNPYDISRLQASCAACNIAQGNIDRAAAYRRQQGKATFLPQVTMPQPAPEPKYLGWSRDWTGTGEWHEGETLAERQEINRRERERDERERRW